MNDRELSADRLILPALGLGLAGDLLFRGAAMGANVPLWFGLLVLAWCWLREGTPEGLERQLLLGILLLATAWAWREDEVLRLLDAIGLGVLLALLPLAVDPEGVTRLVRLTLDQLLLAFLHLGRRGASGLLPPLLAAHRRPSSEDGRLRGLAVHLGQGLALAVPALLIFGQLLGAADPSFHQFLTSLLRFDVQVLARHGVIIGFGGWVAAAMLLGAMSGERAALRSEGLSVVRSLGPVEIMLVLGSLDLLFGGFVAFQLPYLFGGRARVLSIDGLTLATYARQGFFQLVMASALVLPLLLLLERFYQRTTRADWRLFQVLAGTLMALLAAVMVSAVHRMALYQMEFGLTIDRFYASAFLGGVAVTGAWFAATVLRSAPGRFAVGSLLAWGVWLAALHLVNPERLVVETNLRRAATGQPLDTAYFRQLTSDAVPALVAGLDRISPADRASLLDWMRLRSTATCCDWRSWHLGRRRARVAIFTLDSPLPTPDAGHPR